MTTTVPCSNCKEPAVYSYVITSFKDVKYCSRDLPRFLKSPEYAGRVVKVLPLTDTVKEVPSKSTKKKSAQVAEEKAVVEEAPVVEETIVEEVSTEVTEAE
jgi:hypothetical protein